MSLFAKLERSLAEVDALLHRVYKSTARGCVNGLLNGLDAKQVAISSDPIFSELGILDKMKESDFRIINPPGLDMSPEEYIIWKDEVANADVGLTSAFGIAMETGTILLEPHHPDERAISLLPPFHLVVIPKSRVVENISELMKKWQENPENLEGSAVMVTGPSRTADIEKELVLGVHGPQALEVALIL